MKKYILALALTGIFALSACGGADEPAAQTGGTTDFQPTAETVAAPPEPAPPAEEEPAEEPPFEIPDTFLWNNFVGRDPHNMPGVSPNGAPMWWDNWANLRSNVENDIVQIEFRPADFDPYDFVDLDDYFTRAMDWMGNWGEAIDMWALDGISFMRYMVIRISGGEGGEENRLILHFQPNDGPVFAARFSDLITQDGSNVQITTDMQDITIDLAASGFPGMTNRMHIRAFADATIFLDEISFTEPLDEVDTTSNETIAVGFPNTDIGSPAALPIREFLEELGIYHE